MEKKELIIESTPFERDLDRVYQKYIRNALSERNKEYGDTNLLTYGEYGILIRLSDKQSRLENELEEANLNSPRWMEHQQSKKSKEARREVWRDIAGYALQALRIVDETLGNLKEEMGSLREEAT